MKLTVEQKDLSHALAVVNRAISPNNTLPVLNNILLKAEGKKLFFTSTNLEIAINYSVEANVINEGSITIPAKILTNYISLLKSGQVSLEAEEGFTLTVKSQKEHIKIKGINSEEFPLIPQIERKEPFKLPVKTLKEMANQVAFSASNNLSRPVLMGILFEVKNGECKMVATDSYRLSEKKVSLKTEGEVSCIIPSRTVFELSKVVDESDDPVFIYTSKNQVLFEHKTLSLTSRLIEGNFPDYEKIIPKENKTKAEVDKEEFALAVKKVSLFVQENNVGIRVQVGSEKVTIFAEENQVGEGRVEIDAKVEGDSNEITLNAQFFLDVLS